MKASDEGSSAVPAQERMKELVLYSASEPYFKLRRSDRGNLEEAGVQVAVQDYAA